MSRLLTADFFHPKPVTPGLKCAAPNASQDWLIILTYRFIPQSVSLILCVVLIAAMACAQSRAHQVIVALDDSGSMLDGDPQRIRFEATTMFAAISSSQDRLGIIVFGGSARCFHRPLPLVSGAL